MSGFTTFTPEQIAAAPQLEPPFEMTLRAADISEKAITGFRFHRIINAATFAAMDTTPEELKDSVREAFALTLRSLRPTSFVSSTGDLNIIIVF